MFAPISKQTVVENIINTILEMIAKGEIRPGSSLPSERELAESTGINQSAIHLAIKDLERTGFLSIVPRSYTAKANCSMMKNALP